MRCNAEILGRDGLARGCRRKAAVYYENRWGVLGYCRQHEARAKNPKYMDQPAHRVAGDADLRPRTLDWPPDREPPLCR